MTDIKLDRLEMVINSAVEEFVCEGNGDYEWAVYGACATERYVTQEETPRDRSVILQRRSDGARFAVHTQVYVTELTQ